MKVNKIRNRFFFVSGDVESVRSDVPLVEIVGKNRVLIENHNGISEYGCNNICIKAKDGCICINGKDLSLEVISKERVVITGRLESIGLQGDE